MPHQPRLSLNDPSQTFISIRPYVIVRSEKYFHHASSFIPERWLPQTESNANNNKQFANDHLSTSKPFNTGPTSCIGKPLAWAEMRLVISKLVWNFDFSVDADKKLDWGRLRAMMTIEKEAMPLRIKVRSVM